MLGAMLTKDEVDEFMREADVVRQSLSKIFGFFELIFKNIFYGTVHYLCLIG